MSTYTNYDDVSKTYDLYRRASNLDLLVAMIKHVTGKPIQDLSVLDAGCGTGNYALGLLNAGAGHVTMIDGSEGMLDEARKKTNVYGSSTDCQLCNLPELPFPDNSYDVVMYNQVLHHLDNQEANDNNFPLVRKALREGTRVLKKGGVFVIDICTNQQNKYGFWYIQLLGVATNCEKRTPSLTLIREALQDGGCIDVQMFVQLERVTMDYSMYSDLEGALDPSWHRADSSFSEASSNQIAEFCNKILTMKKENTLQAYFEQCEQDRLKVGQTTTIFARKST